MGRNVKDMRKGGRRDGSSPGRTLLSCVLPVLVKCPFMHPLSIHIILMYWRHLRQSSHRKEQLALPLWYTPSLRHKSWQRLLVPDCLHVLETVLIPIRCRCYYYFFTYIGWGRNELKVTEPLETLTLVISNFPLKCFGEKGRDSRYYQKLQKHSLLKTGKKNHLSQWWSWR